jgi:chromosome segregation ATPase
METHNFDLTKVKNSLLSVRKQRGEIFMAYFNKVAEEMPKIYRRLTG